MTGAPQAVSGNSSREASSGWNSDRSAALGHRFSVILLVALSFIAYGAVRAPVPAVNEPHYLAKAKHYWNPSWCAGDFFLDSSNAHLVFYQTFGSLTLWLSLEQTAWIGRVIAALIVAIGWTRLTSLLVPGKWAPLYVAWGFLFLQACGNLSGEWIAGGLESKVPAYGVLFWALSYAIERSWNRAALLAGLAISFHPVVGMWGVIAIVGAEVLRRLISTKEPPATRLSTPVLVRLVEIATPIAILIIASLPGLIPALSIVGVDSFAADYIQVYYRLDHHLDPMQFSPLAAACYVILFLAWFVEAMRSFHSAEDAAFNRFVLLTALIAFAGLLAGIRLGLPEEMAALDLRMKILKLYPFRLFDALLPMAAAVSVVRLITSSSRRCVLFGAAMLVSLLLPSIDRDPSRMEPEQFTDWLDACRWISKNTPHGSIVYTEPRESWAFKWYAERAEFVSFKDCPQDAAGIVEWNDRLMWLQEWGQRTYGDGTYSVADLRELNTAKGITHVLARRLGPMEQEPIFQNGTFRVYALLEPGMNSRRESSR